MQYTNLGNTGLRVSRLGFGAMRLPMEEGGERIDRDKAIPMIHDAFESGVNYIDTAVFYCKEDSQRVVGEALKGWRDKIILSTKNHYYGENEKDWWQNLENSLERLDTDHIDIYNTHGVNANSLEQNVKPRIIKWLQRAKDQGLIKHICTSFHDNNDGLVKVVESGLYASITLQYNMLDLKLEEGIALAHERGMGVVAMGPVGGGRLGASNEILDRISPSIKRIPELALRFVLSNPNVDIALSGMSEMVHVKENVQIASDERPLSDDDYSVIKEHLERLKRASDLYCTGCGYCKPCPENVDIPRVFDLYNQARIYGFKERSRNGYKGWAENQDNSSIATACVECGKCEDKCPQNIPIIKQLKEAHAYLCDEA